MISCVSRAILDATFPSASLRRLLTNAIYAGKVEHRGAIYTGEQASIVEPSMWQEVNTELRSGRRAAKGRPTSSVGFSVVPGNRIATQLA